MILRKDGKSTPPPKVGFISSWETIKLSYDSVRGELWPRIDASLSIQTKLDCLMKIVPFSVEYSQ